MYLEGRSVNILRQKRGDDLAAQLPDRNNAPLRGSAYSTIFSLLFGLGLRVGEVARLRWRDVDCDRDVLTIRETKFSKSRLIPMGPRLAQRLYAFPSRPMFGGTQQPSIFLSRVLM